MNASPFIVDDRHARHAWRKNGLAMIPTGLGLYRFEWRDSEDGWERAECLAATAHDAWQFVTQGLTQIGWATIKLRDVVYNETGKDLLVR